VTTGKEAYVRALDPLAAYKRVWREWMEGIKMIEEKDLESDHCWIHPADGEQLETKVAIEEIPECYIDDVLQSDDVSLSVNYTNYKSLLLAPDGSLRILIANGVFLTLNPSFTQSLLTWIEGQKKIK